MSTDHQIGDILDVRVERIVPRGLGIAFQDGLTLLVALAAPGDELSVRITGIKKRLAFAEIVAIRKPGDERRPPPCKYFGECGGCDFQQLNYEAQLAAKCAIIRDALKRIGKIDFTDDIPIIRSPELEYRSRVRWQVDPENRSFGYFRRGSHETIDIEHCPKITPELNATLRDLRASNDYDALPAYGIEISAVSGDGGVSLHSTQATEPATDVAWSSGKDTYTFSAETFFQANKILIPQLIETVIGGTQGAIAFDLYSGVGLFTLPLARAFEKVIAVEGHPTSSDTCRRNIENAGLSNANAVTRGVAEFLRINRTRDVDLVVLDPPRSGTEKGVIKMIADLQPREISYVSCDPSILARDLRELVDAGYSISSLTAFDLFPQTHHVETVSRLTR